MLTCRLLRLGGPLVTATAHPSSLPNHPVRTGSVANSAPAVSYRKDSDGKDYTQPLKVLKDPHSNGSEGDIQLQTRLMTSLTTQIDGVVDAMNQIELLRGQLADLQAVLPQSGATASGNHLRRTTWREAVRNRAEADSHKRNRPRPGRCPLDSRAG